MALSNLWKTSIPWILTTYLYALSDVGNYDRVVIQDLLKEVAQTQQVDAAAQKRFKGRQQ